MFKIIGSALKGVVKGVRDILPIPNIKDGISELKIQRILELGKDQKGAGRNTKQLVEEFLDILDDGKRNHSVKDAKVETISRIVAGAVPAAAYIIHGITTGNWIIF